MCCMLSYAERRTGRGDRVANVQLVGSDRPLSLAEFQAFG